MDLSNSYQVYAIEIQGPHGQWNLLSITNHRVKAKREIERRHDSATGGDKGEWRMVGDPEVPVFSTLQYSDTFRKDNPTFRLTTRIVS